MANKNTTLATFTDSLAREDELATLIERHCDRLEYLCGIYAPKSIVDKARHLIEELVADYVALHKSNEERLMDCLRVTMDA